MSTLYEETFEYRMLFRTQKKIPECALMIFSVKSELSDREHENKVVFFNITSNVILLQMKKRIWLYFLNGGKIIMIDILKIYKIDIFISVLCDLFALENDE